MNSKASIPAGAALAILALIAVGLLFILDPLARARLANAVIVWLIPVLIAAVAGVVIFSGVIADRVGMIIAGVVIGAVGLTGFAIHRDWQTHLSYAATVEETSDPVPDFDDRAPHQVAARQATSSLSGINGTPARTAYLPADDLYTTLVEKPGLMNPGYTALVSQDIALTGQAKGSTCRFSDRANDRIGGVFGYSLAREIAAVDSRLIVSPGDAYGYCDGDIPMVAVPVTKLHGLIVPVHKPAGVALYNGKTGVTELLEGEDTAKLPGGAVGLRYSERVNDSMKTWDGTWWTVLMKQSGLTDQPKDEDDPNALNATNFALRTGHYTAFASPLTSVASSVTVDAVLVMDSSVAEAGEAPVATMHRLATPRSSNAATADRVKAEFSDLAWASGIFIQEIVPAADGEWAASIGLNQNITHRVLIKDDGSSCLQDAYGNVVRCSGDPKAQAPEAGREASQGPVAVPDDISKLSDAELEQLLQTVTAEVFNRLGKTRAP